MNNIRISPQDSLWGIYKTPATLIRQEDPLCTSSAHHWGYPGNIGALPNPILHLTQRTTQKSASTLVIKQSRKQEPGTTLSTTIFGTKTKFRNQQHPSTLLSETNRRWIRRTAAELQRSKPRKGWITWDYHVVHLMDSLHWTMVDPSRTGTTGAASMWLICLVALKIWKLNWTSWVWAGWPSG